MNKPILSIVIANFNYGRYLDGAIQSILQQGVGDDIELIICDAASSDESLEVIKRYANGLPPNTSRRMEAKVRLSTKVFDMREGSGLRGLMPMNYMRTGH